MGAVTSIAQFTNKNDEKLDVIEGTGVTFTDLFGREANTTVYKTSDGDNTVDDKDTWAIFYQADSIPGEERVVAVELLGHRRGDYRDVLHMEFDHTTEDLFLGLRNVYELYEEDVDGEIAYLAYTPCVGRKLG